MHFHVLSECTVCNRFATYSTPIADILLLASICQSCGQGTTIGRYPEFRCLRCDTMFMQDTIDSGHPYTEPS